MKKTLAPLAFVLAARAAQAPTTEQHRMGALGAAIQLGDPAAIAAVQSPIAMQCGQHPPSGPWVGQRDPRTGNAFWSNGQRSMVCQPPDRNGYTYGW
jgi:hypothetical protein